MIIDSLTNANKYASIHPLFGKAFEYIRSLDLAGIEPGKYEVSGDELKAIAFDSPAKTAAESLAKFECHNKHIDIQLCIQGAETIGWKPRESCSLLKGEYNPEKDVAYYGDAPDMYFELHDGQFAILFPEDVHAPMIGEGNIKKLVIKVKI
jgi:biofilm protein TabA